MVSHLLILEVIASLNQFQKSENNGDFPRCQCQGSLRLNSIILRIREICLKCFFPLPIGGACVKVKSPSTWVLVDPSGQSLHADRRWTRNGFRCYDTKTLYDRSNHFPLIFWLTLVKIKNLK